MLYDVFNMIELSGKILDGDEEQHDKESLCEQVLAYFYARRDKLQEQLAEYQEYIDEET